MVREGRARRLGVLAGLSLLLGVATWAADAPGSAPGAAGDGAPLCDLLRELRLRQLAPGDEAEARRAACQAVLDAFATGGRVVLTSAGGGATTPEPGELVPVARAEGGRFGYLRVAAVEPGLAAELQKVRTQVSVSSEGGIVVDLRQGAGNGLAAVTESAELLGTWGQPLVVVIDGSTRGAAEALAARLRESQGAVLLGKPTRGLPYAMRQVHLQGGLDVLLPDVPAGGRAEPLQPDVPAADRGGVSTLAPMGQGMPQVAEEQDVCVRQALDLLTAICAFRQKHF